MILHKSLKEGMAQSSSQVGLKIVGGKLLQGNRIGAVIEKVRKGSVADTAGRLLPGKFALLSILDTSNILHKLFSLYLSTFSHLPF